MTRETQRSGARPRREERAVQATAVAALAGVAAWVVKFVSIAAQGFSESPVDVAAFVVGLVLLGVGGTSVALRLTAGRSAVVTVLACVLAAGLVVVLTGVLATLSAAVFGEGTPLGSEGGLGVLMLIMLAVGITGLRRSGSLSPYRDRAIRR